MFHPTLPWKETRRGVTNQTAAKKATCLLLGTLGSWRPNGRSVLLRGFSASGEVVVDVAFGLCCSQQASTSLGPPKLVVDLERPNRIEACPASKAIAQQWVS